MKSALTITISLLLIQFSISKQISSTFEIESSLKHNQNDYFNDTLIFAHIIYRHGQRHTDGAKELTNTGKMQMFESGQYFRRRYNEILGDKYSDDKVYVLSSDMDRSIMSALANLAGLFVPNDEEIWNNRILWQPIPVHTLPKQVDILFHGGKTCKKYEDLYEYYMTKSPEALEIGAKYGHLFAYWAEMSGEKVKTIDDVGELYKKLVSEKDQNICLPDWAEEAIKPNGTMENIAMVNYKLRGSPDLVRLRSGFLIKEILIRTEQKINSTLHPDRSLWFYSAHSSTVTTLLNGLGISELHTPPHGTSLHFELFKTHENEHYLQLFYRKPDDEYPISINVPGCGTKWTLNQFHSVYENLIPGDFDTECQLTK